MKTARAMRTCKICNTRYWRLHTWDECAEALRAGEEQARADDARRRLTETMQVIRSRS